MKRSKHRKATAGIPMTDESAFLRAVRSLAAGMEVQGRARLRMPKRDVLCLRGTIRQLYALGAYTDEVLGRLRNEARLVESCLDAAEEAYAPMLPAVRSKVRILELMQALLAGGENRLDEESIRAALAEFDKRQELEMCEIHFAGEALRIALLSACAQLFEKMLAEARSRLAAEAWVEGDKDRLPRDCSDVFLERALQLSEEQEKPERRDMLDRRIAASGRHAVWVVEQAQKQRACHYLWLDNLMHARRILEQMDWQECFEAISPVEAELCGDPGGIYPEMDDESRAAVREELAQIARRLHGSELCIARHATRAAAESGGNVCTFLMTDSGRQELLRRMGVAKKLPPMVPDASGRRCVAVVCALTAAVLAMLSALVVKPQLMLYTLPLAWVAAMEIIGRFFPKFVRPKRLLKMQLRHVPEDARTLVVLPVLLGDAARAREMVRHMEVLGCLEQDANIDFLLLGDFRDADSEHVDGDEAIIETARTGTAALNSRTGRMKYYYLHRARRLREKDNRWMGENRKRGALTSLNRMLLGLAGAEEFTAEGAACKQLSGRYRYVVTLDADTEYLPGTLQKLIGAMLHPLNRRREENGAVCGYSILQPCMQMSLKSNVNAYVALTSGFGGMDAYPVTVSDFYQDMCAQGSFSGKGIYDLSAFYNALEGKLPDREILSHDLIEGILSGCATVSDVCFYDEQPAQLGSEMNRLHRWTRGDWQLLRVIFGRMKLGALGRLKLLGNLLRSLYAPALLGLLIHSCWTDARSAFAAALLLAFLVPLLHPFAGGLRLWKAAVFRLACLPVYAFVQSDAIIRALWRVLVSGRKLMEWVPAADASGQGRNLHMPGRIACILLLPGLMRPFWIPTVLALGALFLIGPAWADDLAAERTESEPLTPEQSDFLKDLARRTWAFFEECVSYDETGLPPDNLQLDPPVGAASRTSPTNIGLYMMSCVAAHELGFISQAQMLHRLQSTTATLEGLEKWNGQLYNWYDVHTLQPLHPRYVSSVDSGNLAGALLLCAQAVRDEALSARIRRLAEGMNLAVFFDSKRELFAIGADVDNGSISRSYYDLYASESRILSYSAMMLGQVPLRHWQRLARPQQYAEGECVLLSWSGTMFEYLMPELLLRSHPDSFAGRGSRAAVHAQMRFARRCARPWGVSESGHCQFDLQLNYQYRAFGLRSLALSGNAAQDVVAPYACALALCIHPQQAVENLQEMCALGWLGEYGLYEAADYTGYENGRHPKLVRSYMAHHQGMALCAMCNALRRDVLSRTFFEIPQAQALRLLLEEKPGRLPRLRRRAFPHAECAPSQKLGANYARSGRDSSMDVHLLHGGPLTLLANAHGGLYASAHGIQLNRFSGDLNNAAEGMYLHYSNLTTGEKAVLGAVGKTRFAAGAVSSQAHIGSIEVHTHCFVSPESGIAYRQIEIENHAGDAQEIALANCFAVALAPAEAMRSHPAFQNLFVSVQQDESMALVHVRRPREGGDEKFELLHAVCGEGVVTAETDMERLTGRCGLISHAGGISEVFSGTDAGVNPASALRIRFRLDPGEVRKLHFAFVLCRQEERNEYLERARSQTEATRARNLAEIKEQAVLNYAQVNPVQYRLFQRAAAFLLDTHLHIGVREEHTACEPASRRTLWQAGISGDLPLILVELSDDACMENLRTVIHMHAFYKLMGVAADLVFLDMHGSDYRRDLRDALLDRISSSHLNCLRGKKGGVFIVESANASAELCAALKRIAAIRFVAGQDVAAQLRGMLAGLCKAEEIQMQPLSGVLRGDVCKLRFFNGFGGFNGEGAYQIEIKSDCIPPAPWCNILANDTFGAVLTDRGGGFAWARNSRNNRLTSFGNDTLHEGWGWMFCLTRGNQSIGLLPGKIPQTDYGVTFRPGSAAYCGACEGVRFTTEVSVINEGVCFEIMLQGTSEHKQEIEISGSVDWLMGTDAADAALLRCWNKHSACFASGASDWIGYFVSDNPTARPSGGNSALEGRGMCIPLKLKANETHKIRFLLGAAEDIPAAYRRAKRFGSGMIAKNDPEITGIMAAMKIETPDEEINLLANGFLQAQVLHSRVLGRTGLYQPGGAYGFRDQLQDMLPLIYTAPQRVRSHLLYCAARQFPSGDVLHWWHDPYTGVRTHISDDLLFLPYVAACYVQATGDAQILDENIPFLEEIEIPSGRHDLYAEMQPSQECDSLHGHCMRAFRRAARFGEHGLCLMGGGDWNDGMNRVGEQGRGESVWLTEFLLACAREYAKIAPDPADRTWLAKLQDELAAAIEHSGWDGKWYLRAYTDAGQKLGSHTCRECRIDLISQAWAVLAGLDSERCGSALDAAWIHLADAQAHIIKLLDPPFTGDDFDPGYIAAYPRGVRENGAQYTHAACWLLIALVRFGDAERAHQALQYLLPVRHSDTPEKALRYRVEPYVMAADVYAHPELLGRGGWTWYTGSAAWMLMAIYELLGFERRGNCVRLNALLGTWPQASVVLRFGSSEYKLVSTGEVSQVFLDAMPMEGEFIEMLDDGKKHVAMFPCRKHADVMKK